jgi:hypothetical protein
MALEQDIASVVEAHTLSYIAAILSPATVDTQADKMATHFLPTTSSFADGSIIPIPDQATCTSIIKSTLENLSTEEGNNLAVKGHRTEAVEENSAIAWITFEKKGVVWSNVYLFRRLQSGEIGWEGCNFDGEMRALRELANL